MIFLRDWVSLLGNINFNKSLELGKFPSEIKLTDVTPVFKKKI